MRGKNERNNFHFVFDALVSNLIFLLIALFAIFVIAIDVVIGIVVMATRKPKQLNPIIFSNLHK